MNIGKKLTSRNLIGLKLKKFMTQFTRARRWFMSCHYMSFPLSSL